MRTQSEDPFLIRADAGGIRQDSAGVGLIRFLPKNRLPQKTVKRKMGPGPGTLVTKQTGDMGNNPFTREVADAVGRDELHE